MWLQGVSLAQGVNKGPLSGGGNVWYLVPCLSSFLLDLFIVTGGRGRGPDRHELGQLKVHAGLARVVCEDMNGLCVRSSFAANIRYHASRGRAIKFRAEGAVGGGGTNVGIHGSREGRAGMLNAMPQGKRGNPCL